MKRHFLSILLKPVRSKIVICVFAAFLFSPVIYGQKNLDSIVTVNQADADSAAHFEDNETREKHIYDTSDHFFNWKEDADEVYYARKLQGHPGSEAALQEMKKDKDFWYVGEMEKFQANKAYYLKRGDSLARLRKISSEDEMLKTSDGFENIPWLRAVLWIIIIGILLFALVYFLTVNKLSLFAKKDILHKIAGEEESGVDIFQTQFDDVLAKARAEKNFRLMTRILYLQTLRLLSDKKVIRYSPNYSNLTYIDQLRSTEYYQDFFTITRHYEYVWYGKFELPEEAYGKIETAIHSFQKRFVEK
jgi:hypothetical protein